MSTKFRIFSLLLGDLILMAVSLGITLLIRYGKNNFLTLFQNHLRPFSLIFVIWLLIFYIIGLYEPKGFKNNLNFAKNFGIGLLINTVAATIFFYLIPGFGITPKTNLLIFIVVFGILDWLWRWVFNNLTVSPAALAKILIIGTGSDVEKTIDYLLHSPQLGFEIKAWLKTADEEDNRKISRLIKENGIDSIILASYLKQNEPIVKTIYQNLASGIEVVDFNVFYQNIFKKVSLEEIKESWILENIAKKQRAYEIFKSFFEHLLAALLIIVFLPIFAIVFLSIKISSRGPALYKQIRVGKNEKQFNLYKFRTMKIDAEKNGPQWSQPNDPRITKIGKILRFSHLDELPQLINVLKGELSFVGPRPERPEFVRELKEKIPYYEIRHIIKPGFTGWAQTNYRYGASLKDAYEKLQYDIYYIKNRSPILDLLIIVKTAKLFFGKI